MIETPMNRQHGHANRGPKARLAGRQSGAPRRRWHVHGPSLLLCAALAVLVAVPGCGGCLNRDPLAKKKELEEAEKKKKEKPKPDFQIGRLRMQLSDPTRGLNRVKPGHWMTATQPMKANNFDFQAELDTAVVDRGGDAVVLPNTTCRMRASRPGALPKGQTKHFEMTYFIPPATNQTDTSQVATVWFQNKLRARRGGREVASSMEGGTPMPDWQYFFVVLSDNPDRYGYVKQLDTIAPPVQEETGQNVLHYRVLLPEIRNRVPLPSQPLAWTTIAYVLWDGLNPRLLTPPQQQAMLDWLHWGGGLVISGPNSMDMLRGSFLEKYLPASGGEAVSIPAATLAELDAGWSIRNRRTGKRASLDILPERLPVGVQFSKAADAEYVPGTGRTVIERWVGRGRVVVTAFSLSERQIVNWGSYDSFFNGALLRRPRRVFRLSSEMFDVEVQWDKYPGVDNQKKARFTTGLRYFTRDGLAAARTPAAVARAEGVHVGAWNDVGSCAAAARDSLKEAAGISVPEAGFVFRVLAVYLLVLAPVNWAFFRVMGRVEWAWLAAPAIAIVGAMAVVRLAQLDIGFARSRTEIGVLEMYGGYPRGHLTRYTALYTSLSTSYDLAFDDDSALALPFPHTVPYQRRIRESIDTVHFRRDRQVSLGGFPVQSNSTGLVHSEMMWRSGGAIDLLGDAQRGWQVRNGTELDLRDVVVLRGVTPKQMQGAWIGSLEAGATASLDFAPVVDPKQQFESWYVRAKPGGLSLSRFFDLAAQPGSLAPDAMRLIGWTDQELPGMTIRPGASQKMLRTLTLVHLRPGGLPPPQPDVNLRSEVAVQADGQFDWEGQGERE